MNVLAFLLAVAAIVVFVLAAYGRVWGRISLGLALLTSAWIIQLAWTGPTIGLG